MRTVTAPCRQRLTEDDYTFISSGTDITADSGAAFVDELLDQPFVRERLLESPCVERVSPQLYFYVLARCVLREAGIDDRALADYLGALLVLNLESQREQTAVPYVVDHMMRISEARGAERFFHIVELAERLLFLTGLFPHYLEQRSERRGAPSLHYYAQISRSHYRAASGHSLAQEYELAAVYALIAEAHDAMRHALNQLSERLVFLGECGQYPWSQN
ncbi:MAG: hypothetical protein AAGF10_00370 [Verrucomicrobiota bacterium]